ncbi:MAG TPA: NADH-quinone oxidoreductase subunit L, partial [Chitinimonas sp.]
HEHDHHSDEHADEHHHGLGPNDKPRESPWVVTLPLILLAVPSLIIGYIAIEPMLYGDFFKGVIDVSQHPVMHELAEEFEKIHGPAGMALHGLMTAPFWLALFGVVVAWFFYMKRPDIPAAIKAKTGPINTLLENKYYMDHLYIQGFAAFGRGLGKVFWKAGDTVLIDGLVVNGAAKLVGAISGLVRRVQTGYIYHYAFAMIIGALVLLTVWLGRYVIPH